MHVLVINCGSSSLKYAIIDTASSATLTRGLIERIGVPQAAYSRGGQIVKVKAFDHVQAMEAVAKFEDFSNVRAVGHRVVHGGTAFNAPTLINEAVLESLEANAKFAPLHNPPNIAGIRATRALLPDVPSVAVFDTGFHASLPKRAFLYAIPLELYQQHGMRRYGFHGTSHAFVANEAARTLGKPLEQLKIITLHIGNGASACAVLHGKSVDTTMGFTPLEGLVMGSRSGDIDAGLVLELTRRFGTNETDALLNKLSGMLGLAGASDLRDVWKKADTNDEAAHTALDLFAYRVQKTIGAYAAAMNGVDAIVFTAGVGENDARMRALICSNLEWFGVRLDQTANLARDRVISASDAKVKLLVIPTDEELAIALETAHMPGITLL